MTDRPPLRSGQSLNIALALILLVSAGAFFASVQGELLQWCASRISVWAMMIAPGLAVTVACAGFGLWFTPAQGFCRTETAVFSLAAGIGVASSLAFVAGMSGWLTPGGALAIITAGLVSGLIWLRTNRACVAAACPIMSPDNRAVTAMPSTPRRVAGAVLWGLVMLMAAMIFMIALTPPLIFDVTEYHLGAWTSYAAMGRFVPMPYNLYGRFPFPIESIYFTGLAASPALDTAPKLFNAICCIACAALAALYARRLGGRGLARPLAALLVLAHPIMAEISTDALIDAPLALLVAGSFYAGMMAPGRFALSPQSPTPRSDPASPQTDILNSQVCLLALLTFGTALASKYTIAQMFLLPWVLFIFLPLAWHFGRRNPGTFAISLLIAAVPCLLWLGKNLAWYDNPFEPFLTRWLNPQDAAAVARESFLRESHHPQGPLTSAFWVTLVPRLGDFSWLLLAACAGLLYRKKDRRPVILLLVACVMAYLPWNTIGIGANRFLMPLVIILAALAAVGAQTVPSRAVRGALYSFLALFAMTQEIRYGLTIADAGVIPYVFTAGPSSRTTDWSDWGGEAAPREEFLKKNLGQFGEVLNDTNRILKDTDRLLLVYEARPYLFRHDPLYNVVWDRSVLLDIIRPANSAEDALQLLRKQGVTHVLVNRPELLRYIRQYITPAQRREYGIMPQTDARVTWSMTDHPEDLFPPFYMDKDWERLRPILHDLLDQFDKMAITRKTVAPAPPAGAAQSAAAATLPKALDVYLARL